MIWPGVNVSKFPRVATPPTKTPTKPPIFRGIWDGIPAGYGFPQVYQPSLGPSLGLGV